MTFETNAGLDRWVWWPTASAVAMVAVFVFVGGLPGPLNVPLSLLSIVVCPLAGLLLTGAAIILAWLRRPRGAISAFLALASAAVLSIPMFLLAPYVHLGLMLAFGIGHLGPLPQEDADVRIYDWSTGVVHGGNTFLIYDKTDAISVKRDTGIGHGDVLRDCAGNVRRLMGHYYICYD